MKFMAELPFPWNVYEEKQNQLMRSQRITSHIWGIETGLDKLLTDVETGSIPIDQTDLEREVQKNISSADWTERNRARLRRTYLPPVPELDPAPQRHPAAFSASEVEGHLHSRILLIELRRQMTSTEWTLIVRVASGFDCNELAQASGSTAGNIRTRLSRLRARLKKAA
jgi:hypothetical protein